MVQLKKWQVFLVVLFGLVGIIFSLPNFFKSESLSSLPSFVPKNQITLGLDLQGGSYLLLEVDVNSVVNENLGALSDDIKILLRKNKISVSDFTLQNKDIFFKIKKDTDKEPLDKLLVNYSPDITFDFIENNSVKISFTDTKFTEIKNLAVAQSIEVVRRRVDEFGTKEPTILRQGSNRILLELPGINDPERLKKLLGKTAKLFFHIVDDSLSYADLKAGKKKPGTFIVESDKGVDAQGEPVLFALKKKDKIPGDLLVNASPTLDKNSPVVSFQFNNKGGRKFGNITTKYTGKQLAILLDNKVISAPNIREPIVGGNGIITGQFTFQEVTDLSMLLRAGALPAPLNVLEERSIGPSLGADSVESGKFASVLGLILIFTFMIMVYGTFGFFANIALIFNIFILFAVLTIINATLTLPGIAGIVLTIGMAVDANVIIFERIREELSTGTTVKSAIDSAYKRAFVTILDANITTLIAAFVLWGIGLIGLWMSISAMLQKTLD